MTTIRRASLPILGIAAALVMSAGNSLPQLGVFQPEKATYDSVLRTEPDNLYTSKVAGEDPPFPEPGSPYPATLRAAYDPPFPEPGSPYPLSTFREDPPFPEPGSPYPAALRAAYDPPFPEPGSPYPFSAFLEDASFAESSCRPPTAVRS